MRLGGYGSLIQISDAGMKAFFRDTISSVDSPVFGKGQSRLIYLRLRKLMSKKVLTL